jgi:hypothetical protein
MPLPIAPGDTIPTTMRDSVRRAQAALPGADYPLRLARP